MSLLGILRTLNMIENCYIKEITFDFVTSKYDGILKSQSQ